MLTTREWILFSFLLFAALLGLAVSAILFFMNRTKMLAPRLLAAYLCCFSLFLLHISLTFTDILISYPHIWRSTAILSFYCPVLTYLYVRSVVTQSFKLRKLDWLFFVPGILYCINLLPFYLRSAEEKRIFINMFLQDRRLIALEPEGILSPGWGVSARILIGLSLVIMQLRFLSQWKRKHHANLQNKDVFKWLWLFSLFHLMFYFFVFVNQMAQFTVGWDLTVMLSLVYFGNVLFISSYLFLKPSILYGFTGWPMKDDKSTLPDFLQLSGRRTSFSIKQGELIRDELLTHIVNSRPFLKQGYRIRDLSEELNIPVYQLSAFINQEFGKNFNEWINEFRIQHISETLKNTPEKMALTLEALAKEAGFSSRTAFFSAVKKQTGMPPSDFFKTDSGIE